MARPASSELTARQREVFTWIKSFAAEHGVPPTVREIGKALKIESSSVFDMLKALERKGALRRGNLGARSLIIHEEHGQRRRDSVEIPVVGRIAAGAPIEAIEDRATTIAVDTRLLRGREAYALRVQGDSMIEDGILDGDVVVVLKQQTAENGDTVVALIGEDATLKRFHREKHQVRLEPANSNLKPIRVRPDRLRIQGKVIGVQRLFGN